MTNKKRLIDANTIPYRSLNVCGGHGLYYDETIAYKEDIDVLPTVDAVEVVHGEWVVCGDGEYVPFMCSACGKTTSWYHAQTANYCPNCGAKMDGDGNGDS